MLITLDLLSAYFQLRVAPEDWHLLTFLLPTGKYQFKKLPMGWTESQDHLNQNIQCLLVNIPTIQAMMDDFLLTARGLNDAYEKCLQLLINAVMSGWVFSRKKMKVSTSVDFCGLTLQATREGAVLVTPTKDRLKALVDFPSPTTKKRSNHLSVY